MRPRPPRRWMVALGAVAALVLLARAAPAWVVAPDLVALRDDALLGLLLRRGRAAERRELRRARRGDRVGAPDRLVRVRQVPVPAAVPAPGLRRQGGGRARFAFLRDRLDLDVEERLHDLLADVAPE